VVWRRSLGARRCLALSARLWVAGDVGERVGGGGEELGEVWRVLTLGKSETRTDCLFTPRVAARRES
jgi:hypothetical protein